MSQQESMSQKKPKLEAYVLTLRFAAATIQAEEDLRDALNVAGPQEAKKLDGEFTFGQKPTELEEPWVEMPDDPPGHKEPALTKLIFIFGARAREDAEALGDKIKTWVAARDGITLGGNMRLILKSEYDEGSRMGPNNLHLLEIDDNDCDW